MDIRIWDIETLKECFLLEFYDPKEDKWWEFGVNTWENSLDGLFKWLEENRKCYFVGYNNLGFDALVLEWVLRNYEHWVDVPNLEICRKIWQKAQDVIDDSNYGVFPEYREWELTYKQIDLPRIWHFFNENKRVSLKALEFAMDLENIEEMPISHDKQNLTQEEIQLVKSYCKNDVLATNKFYLYTIGETEDILYKGQNKILDRQIVEEETGLKCLNWDDVKIGAEWNKLDYMALTGRKEKDLKPKKINHFFGKKYRQFFPPTVKFQTKALQKFVTELGDTFIKNEKQEFKFDFSVIGNVSLIATIARGGIHSNEKGRFLKPNDTEIYYQCDIGSQYPNFLRKRKVYPLHLGPEWNDMLIGKIERRLKYKKLAKETKERKYNSLQEMGKLALNGGAYGRLNTKGDWQEDPCAMLKVTMGCQLEILMIVEALVLKRFNIVSLNTDGWDAIVPRDRDGEFKAIITEYEKIIGNDVLGQIEYTEFLWIAQTSVNDYIAQKKEAGVNDRGIKKKGDFLTDLALHQNKSKRIIPIALERYFVDNVPVEETIRNHKNIFDFCIRQKSSKDFHFEGHSIIRTKNNHPIASTREELMVSEWEPTQSGWIHEHLPEYTYLTFEEALKTENEWRRKPVETISKKTVYNKLIRYYVSEKGEKILKIKNPSCQTDAAPVSQIEAGEWVCTVCNHLLKDTVPQDVGVNFKYYIDKTNEIIEKVKLEGRKPAKKQPANQISLF